MNVYNHQVICQHLALLQKQLEAKGILLNLIELCRFMPSEKPNYVLIIKMEDFPQFTMPIFVYIFTLNKIIVFTM